MLEMADQLWISAEIKRGSVVRASITHCFATTTEDTFGSLLDKMEMAVQIKVWGSRLKLLRSLL